MSGDFHLTAHQQWTGLTQHWPHELRPLRAYLPYRTVPRPSGRLAKQPCQLLSGRLYPVDVADLRHHLTFEAALDLLAAGRCAGVGLALDPERITVDGWPLTAVDLDGVVSGGHLNAHAQDVLSALGPTYTELSPSGHGIHALALGRLPPHGRRGAGLEFITTGFVTVTGCPWPGSAPSIQPCQIGLAALHARIMPPPPTRREHPPPSATTTPSRPPLDDAAVLHRARQGRNGQRFVRLYAGDLSQHAGDHSRADLALLRLLSAHSTDPHQLERLFHASALYRPGRWAEPAARDGRTYGQLTLATALAPFTRRPR